MRSRLPLCTIVGLLLLTASEAVIGQQVGCGGYVATPTPPAALWDQLQPAGVIWNTSSYDGNKTLNSNLPAATGVDIENGILFTAYWAGYALFDLRNGPVPPPDPNGGRPAPLAMIDGWSGGFSPGIFINSTHNEVDQFVYDIDAPEGSTSAFALVGQDPVSITLWDSRNLAAPRLVFQDANNGLVKQVYATTIGGRSYAFAASSFGTFIYDMTAASALPAACIVRRDFGETPQSVCPGILVGKLGAYPSEYVHGFKFHGKSFVVRSSGNQSSAQSPARLTEIWNVTDPTQPVRVARAYPNLGTAPQPFPNALGVATWTDGTNAYLAARITVATGSEAIEAWDLTSCLDTDCGTLGAGNGTPLSHIVAPDLSLTSPNLERLSFSFSSGKPMLFAAGQVFCRTSDRLSHGSGYHTEMLLDMSNPAAPVDISPQRTIAGPNGPLNYWTWFYPDGTSGPSWASSMDGKFNGQYFYRADHTLFDVHKWVANTTAPTADFTWSPQIVYAGDPATFTDTSVGTVTSRTWTFGGGVPATSVASPQSVVFASVGTHSVSLAVANSIGGNSVTKSVVVSDPSPALGGVSASPAAPTACQPVTFMADNVTGRAPLAYAWSVTPRPNGTPVVASGGGNPFSWNTTGALPGGYRSTVTVSGSGTPATASLDWTLAPLATLPTAGFTPPTCTNCVAGSPPAGTVTLSVSVTGATEWAWDFGDGTPPVWTNDPVQGPHPTHAYSTVGSKSIKVAVRNCVQTASVQSAALVVNITVTTPLVAAFQAQCPFGLCGFPAGTAVSFLDTSTGAELWDYDWTHTGASAATCAFADLAHAAPVAAHTYTQPGQFQPCLRVRRGATEQDVMVLAQPLAIGSSQPPLISVSGPASGIVGQSVTFSASASNCTPSPTGWSWTTSGGAGASTASNIAIVWSTAGNKTVGASNSACPGATGSASIGIGNGGGGGGGGGGNGLSAAFAFTPAAPQVNQPVQFDGSASLGTPTSFAWDFGDGQTSSGASTGASHAYAQAGTFTVKLEVAKPGASCPFGVCTAVVAKQVTVQGGVPFVASFSTDAPCAADLAGVRCTAATGEPVAFTSTTAGATHLAWSFGDGGTAGGATVTHTFSAPGTFTVELAASDGTHDASTAKTFVVTGAAKPTGTLVLPWIAQVDGARPQASDLFVHNPGATPLVVGMTFYKRGTPEAHPPRVTRTIPAGATLYAPDAIRSVFGKVNLTGLLTLSVDQGDAMPVLTSFHVSGAPSGPQFGQVVSATLRGSTTSLAGGGAGAVQELVGLSDDGGGSAIFGVSNPTDGPATFRVRFFDAAGNPIGKSTPAVTLSRFGLRQYQLSEIRGLFGVSATSDYRVEIDTLSGGPLLPFGSNVRSGSGDPSFLDPAATGRANALLVGARNGGAWRTDLLLANLSTAPLTSTLSFTPVGVAARPTAAAHVSLQPGETRRFVDVLQQQLGVGGGVGTLTVSSAGAGGVYPVVQAETYDASNPARRFGQTTLAQGDGDAAGPGQGLYLVGLRQDARFHTAFWLANPGTDLGTYDVIYRDLAGQQLGTTIRVNLLGGKSRAFQPAQHPLPAAGIDGGFTVQVLVRGGHLLAAAQVVFEATNDPAYVRGVVR